MLRRLLLVAGFNTLARIYAFRLGALIQYDGSLTSAVRNFVASHTTKGVRGQLPDHSAEQKRSIETRRDITRMRADLEAARNARPWNKEAITEAKATLDQRRRVLHDLLVLDARAKYFAQANDIRAEGDSTAELRKQCRPA